MKKLALILALFSLTVHAQAAAHIDWTITPPTPVTGNSVLSYNIYQHVGPCVAGEPTSNFTVLVSGIVGTTYTQNYIPTGTTAVCSYAVAIWSIGGASAPSAYFQLSTVAQVPGGPPLGLGGKYYPN